MDLDKQKLVKLINDVIAESVLHGGDYGGPYLVNLNKQRDSVIKLAEYLGVGCKIHKYNHEPGVINDFSVPDETVYLNMEV